MLRVVDHEYLYMLTVWNKGRKMIYKECLEDFPICWNFFGSKLLYMITDHEAKIIDFSKSNEG